MVFQDELSVPANRTFDGLFQQARPALHHSHPIPSNLHHSAMGIESYQLRLLGQQHSGGGELKTGQNLLPEFRQIVAIRGWLWLSRWRL